MIKDLCGANTSGGGCGGGEGNLQTLITITTTNVSNLFEYSSLYPAPLNAFMAGTQFFTTKLRITYDKPFDN
jgi:hypothetical protein